MTTREDIRGWFIRGVRLGHTHMVVICDTFDYGDYPSYLTGSAEEAREYVRREDGTNMQKVMEVYNLKAEREEQLSRFRCWEY